MTLEEIGQRAIDLRRATLEAERLRTASSREGDAARRALRDAEQALNAAIDEYEERGQYGQADGTSEMD